MRSRIPRIREDSAQKKTRAALSSPPVVVSYQLFLKKTGKMKKPLPCFADEDDVVDAGNRDGEGEEEEEANNS